MGLDMYLEKIIRPNQMITVAEHIAEMREYGIRPKEVAYWRKANAIHKYFVDNVQDGIDDCRYHNEVTKEILEDLLERCEAILDNHNLAPKLLPRCSGFFFGGTDYDEWYYKKVRDCYEQMKIILDEWDNKDAIVIWFSW
jgi:hypothetical protein